MFNRLIQFSLRNRLLVVASAAFIAVYGGLVLKSLPIDVFPDLNRPTVTLMTEAPGMAPEEVETFITFPLESVFNGLPGVLRVRSSSGVGLSIVYIEFDWGSDILKNRQLVAEKIMLVQGKLPPGISPMMGPIASIMGEIQLIGLTSPDQSLSATDLRTIADWTIRPQILAIPGIAQVIAIGGGVKQYQILISAEKLKRYQLSLQEIEEKLSRMNRNTTGGFIDIEDKEFLIRTIGSVKSLEDIANSVVGLHFGKPVLVKDIAAVKVGIQVKRGEGSMNGKPAVILSIQKQPGAHTIELTRLIEEKVKHLERTLPAGLAINSELFKQAHFIEAAVKNVEEAIRDGIFFVVIVLFLFLMNFRTTFITLTAIPLSFLISILVFKWAGLSINTMTLGGLAVAIGELVDDAIVDVENVFRRLRENRLLSKPLPALTVIYKASSEVRSSIVFATIIVVLVFVPLFYLSGIEGRLFIPLGIAYIVSITASLFVSLTVTPALCSLLLRRGHEIEKEESRFVRWLKNKDRKILEHALDRPFVVIGITITLFIGALLLVPMMGKEFLPRFNEGTATISLLTAPGTSLLKSDATGTRAEEILLSIPEVKSVARRTGRAEQDEHAEGVHSSEIDVDFKETGRPREEVLSDIRMKLSDLENIFVSVGQPISHRLDHLLSGVRAQIAIKIFGPELSILRKKGQEVFNALESIEGLSDLQVEQQVLIPQVKIQLMREEAAAFGLSLGDLSSSLEKALHGEVVGQLMESQKVFNIFMRFDEQSRANLDLIRQTLVKIMPDGQRVKLSDIADIYESTGPNIINRENMQRRIVVQANSSGRALDELVDDIEAKISRLEWPEAYSVQMGGQFESQRAASRLILLLGLLSLVGIFLVLYAHFRSTFIALQIMLNIPMALIGSVVAVFVSGRTLSVASLVAFITLCGIASRNGIMMLSHYLHLMKEEGAGFNREMVIRGSLERLVPVLMTALTAALALVPLALTGGQPGKEILQPLAIVILGGLISSTLLDMVVTPTIFFHWGRRSAERATEENRDEILEDK